MTNEINRTGCHTSRLQLQIVQQTVFPLATGQVDVAALQRLHQPGSFLLHPAILDATTHTAGALQNSKKSEEGVTRIPVGMVAFSAPPEPAKHVSSSNEVIYTCHSQFTGFHTDKSAVTDFYLAAHGSLDMKGFQAKIVSNAVRMAKLPLQTAESDRPLDVYATSLEAHATLSSHGSEKKGTAKETWDALCMGHALSAVYIPTRAEKATHVANGLINGASLLQQQLLFSSACHVQVTVAGAPYLVPSCANSRTGAPGAAAAALCSLAKAVSMEIETATVRSLSRDEREPTEQSAVVGDDAFGSAVTSAVHLRPKLMRQPTKKLMQNTRIMPMPRGSLANLKMVPMEQAALQPGEVKVPQMK